jgi:hypothetical protein
MTFSKSGVGHRAGGKGYRVTTGRIDGRATYNVPIAGIGISRAWAATGNRPEAAGLPPDGCPSCIPTTDARACCLGGRQGARPSAR